MTTHKQQRLACTFLMFSFLQTWIHGFNGDHPSRRPLSRLKLTLKSISPIHNATAHQSLSNLQGSKWAMDGVHVVLWQLSRALKLCRALGKVHLSRGSGRKVRGVQVLTPSLHHTDKERLCPLHKVKRPSSDTLYPLDSEEECPGFQRRIRKSSRLFPPLSLLSVLFSCLRMVEDCPLAFWGECSWD